ncbi:Uncharacterised protein [uncultured Clostridium sp.]|nr:Uncharacterised protein [uncultured Clostridium sp.]
MLVELVTSAIIYSQKHQLFAFKGEEFILNTAGVHFLSDTIKTAIRTLSGRYQDCRKLGIDIKSGAVL